MWVGNASCKVNSLDAVTLYCSLPVTHHDLLPTVTVRVDILLLFLVKLAASGRKHHASVTHVSVHIGAICTVQMLTDKPTQHASACSGSFI